MKSAKLKRDKRKSDLIIFTIFFLLFVFISYNICLSKKHIKKDIKTKSLKIEDIKKILFKKEDYKFVLENKPDPFKAFVYEIKITKKPKKFRSALEQIDISEIKLTGIFEIKNQRVALVEDARGRGYFIKVGTSIGLNEGVVKKITKDSVIIEEKVIDFAGRIVTREVTLKLRPAEEKNEQ